jgi:hypothetical protein
MFIDISEHGYQRFFDCNLMAPERISASIPSLDLIHMAGRYPYGVES